jgi:serine/threonine protein kinase
VEWVSGLAVNTAITLGRYEVVKHLAQGGMAEVFLARATGIEGFERHVVIKRIREEQAHDKMHVQMFLDEARLAASLHHHNIVQVHDIGEQQGEYFFVMEYVHGEDVRKLLTEVSSRAERVPLEHVITIVTAAAAGLHHAHEQCGPNRAPLGIVHRDVSPANILVGYDGGVKVADFGVAKAAHRTFETESGARKGKVAYMSPEQCVGLPVDRRSDVFALGIVLYESLTVRRLFKDDNDFLTMTAIVQGKIPPPSTVWPQIPPELEAIVMKALASSPDDRYATADHMRRALEEFAAGIGLRTSTTTLADYMKTQFGRRVEPWLVEDDEPEMELSIDFDGSGSGIVHAPPDALRSATGSHVAVPPPTAPLARARGKASAWAATPAGVPAPGEPETAPVPAAPASVAVPRPVWRRWRWIAGGAGALAVIGLAIILASASRDNPAPAPAVLIQPTVPPAPVAPPPVVVQTPPNEALGSGSDAPAPPDPEPPQPLKKHHHTNGHSKSESSKKHWDPHTLFPQ